MTQNRRRTSAIAAVVAAALALGGCGLFMSPERRVSRAENFIAEGDWGSAAIELRQALEAKPDLVDARLMLARVALHTGDFQSARKELDRAIELGAKPEATARVDADLRLATGDFEGLSKSLAAKGPGLTEAERRMYRGYAALGQGDAAGALVAFESALALNPTGDEGKRVRTAYAEALARTDQMDRAIATLDTVLREDPKYAQAAVQKATILAQRGRWADAQAVLQGGALEASAATLPTVQRLAGYALLVEAELAQGETEQAQKTLEKLKRIAPNALLVPLLTARIQLAEGEPEAAVTDLQKVVNAAPGYVPGRLLLARAMMATGSVAQAEAQLQEALQVEPDNLEVRKLLAEVQLRSGRPDAAVDSLAAAVDANTADPGVYAIVGRAKYVEGDAGSAKEFWERGVEHAGDDVQTQLQLAGSYIAAGDSQRALELLATVPDDKAGPRK